MYAVIFRATVDVLDDEYFIMVKRLRVLKSQKLGFAKMTTAMAIFKNQDRAMDMGLVV